MKLSHDGSIDSNKFILKSNLTSDIEGMSLNNIKDGDATTSFKGRKLTKEEYNSIADDCTEIQKLLTTITKTTKNELEK